MKMNFLLLVLFLFSQVVAMAQPGAASKVSLEKLGDNIYEVQGGSGANSGLFIGEDGVMVIDSKMDKPTVDQVLALIGELTDKPVKYLVNTHSDGDHVNGNPFYPESAIIIAHSNSREEFFLPGRNGSPSMWLSPEMAPFLPGVTFNDKMDIYLGKDKVELWYFGKGHTSGDIVVYFPEQKVAFIGDQIFMNRVPLIHVHKGGNSHSSVEYLEAMLETLDAEKFSSGHSDIAGRDDIRNYIDRMKERQASVAGYVNKNYTIDQIREEFTEDEAALTETIYNEILNK